MSMEFGGNAQGSTGQMEIVAVAQMIPFPSNVYLTGVPKAADSGGTTMTGMEGRRRKIRATDDVYYGYTAQVTAATGFYVPAGTLEDITSRAAIWFVGIAKAGESSSSSLSPVPTSSSSSSGTSIYPTSSSSQVPVTTFGTLYWTEESA